MLLAGVWVMYAAFGLIVSSLAPVLTPLSEDLGLSKSSLGAILGTWPAVFIFAAVPGGWLLDRIGLRWALFAGGMLLCLSGVLRGLATGGVTLFVAVGVFGLGGPMISNGAPKLVVSRFGETERAKATGIYLTGPVAGQIIALATANSVIRPATGGSWRSVPLVLAALTGAVCVLWLMLTARIDTTTPHRAEGRGVDRAGAVVLLRNPVMRTLLVMAVAVFFVNHGMNNWLPKIVEDGGLSAETAGYLAAASAAAGAVGALALPRLGAGRYRLAAPVGVSLCLGTRDRATGSGLGPRSDAAPDSDGIPAIRPRGALPPGAHGRARRRRTQHGCGQRSVLHGGGDRWVLGAVRGGRHRRRHRRIRRKPADARGGDHPAGLPLHGHSSTQQDCGVGPPSAYTAIPDRACAYRLIGHRLIGHRLPVCYLIGPRVRWGAAAEPTWSPVTADRARKSPPPITSGKPPEPTKRARSGHGASNRATTRQNAANHAARLSSTEALRSDYRSD